MRYLFVAFFACVVFISCSKDKYTSTPQITFKSITSPYYNNSPKGVNPILIIVLTDAEGDFGFAPGQDTSYVYVKNVKAPFKLDSFKFPAALSKASKKNFKGDVEINLLGEQNGGTSALPLIPAGATRPYRDTVFYEVYVKDFAKHKSNVIRTADPLIFIAP